MTTREIVAYYNSISSKRFDPMLTDHPEVALPIPDILTQNADMEPYILQAAARRTLLLGDTPVPLTFVHFSDIHACLELWNRISAFCNHYRELFRFAIHTGDYCCDSQAEYRNLYREGNPFQMPVFNCIGNHDTYDANWNTAGKACTWKKVFSDTSDWEARWIQDPNPTAYYRDFGDVRLIVLDLYYDQEKQQPWLQKLLLEARQKGLHVITAMHEHSATVTEPLDVGFQTVTPYEHEAAPVFEDLIAAHIAQGGVFVCNLSGHYHADWLGRTEKGVLNVSVECAADWAGWCDGNRIRGTRTYDSFNVVSVDTGLGLLKLVRIGNQTDLYLRSKKTLCYDYVNRKLISTT